VSYNASAVKIYNAPKSKAHFQNKNYFSEIKKAPAYYNDGILVVNSGAFEFTTTTPAP
jgi:hypothetical protein